ncbi:GyrI-like domain-containing protein [Nocardia vaccinii]|uniref:GyrI-like domain-containing protein n=1 Tax=Nocardia vaccinii TaxID=1822 RepID=UPI00082B3105|nr:GyrI-like domain-containing protein [Nocardia vaccinii]
MTYFDIGVVDDQPEQDAAVRRGHVAAPAIAEFLGASFAEVMRVVRERHVAVIGPPFARYTQTDGGFDVEAGFPVSAAFEDDGEVVHTVLPGGRLAGTMHVGPYDTVDQAYRAMEKWLAERGFEATSAPWESYLDGPEVANPRTIVTMPCAPV